MIGFTGSSESANQETDLVIYVMAQALGKCVRVAGIQGPRLPFGRDENCDFQARADAVVGCCSSLKDMLAAFEADGDPDECCGGLLQELGQHLRVLGLSALPLAAFRPVGTVSNEAA